MDPQTKSAIKSLVLDLRHTLEDELTIVLKRYGLFTDREWSLEKPPSRLTDDADREIWQRIVTVVRRGMKELPSASGGPGGVKEGRTLPEASQDYVRESAFTFLNRLVGLKCLEVRSIIDEVITTRAIYGGRSKAHRDYRDEHPRQARAPDDALPACISAVCRRVNDEMIGYLFDPDDDHSLVWPRYAVLKTCIEKINALDKAVWREDEIIGWIYQFYNAEEKVSIRKRGKPQTPHDVAVINQFFTPRWVVKFLVDNTLGRFWLEMHPGSERVRAKCDYLVPEPLAEAEMQGSRGAEGQGRESFQLDPDSPVNNPQAAPRREPKPITRIRLLDPACGTMHFGHYACEVFDCMYRDARDRGEVEIEDGRIPSAILEHNLFGVDIDRRAVQLAALSLFMKARTMHPQAQVRQVNLVVADATLPDSGIKKKFLVRYAHDKRVQKAFAQVLDDMDNVAQVGSLLRVEERLRELLAKAGHAAAAEGLDPRRQRELPGMKKPVRQMGLAELADEEQVPAWTPHYTLQELRDDLRAFARQALDEHDLNAQLFATEADKAVRLLDVLMSDYDVVVMNPPYGFTTDQVSQRLRKEYGSAGSNLFTAFVKRALEMIALEDGYVGALVDRVFVIKKKYEKFRKDVLRHGRRIDILLDLGWGILDDAYVRTAAVVLQNRVSPHYAHFIRLEATGKHSSSLIDWLSLIRHGQILDTWFCKDVAGFRQFPNSGLVYWLPSSVNRCFLELRDLEPVACEIRQGMASGQNTRFYKWWWEIPPSTIGRGKDWVRLANGGGYAPYYRDNKQVVFWQDNGYEIRNLRDDRGRTLSRVQNEKYFFRSGITYGKRGELLSAQRLEENHIFSNEGMGIFPIDPKQTWSLLAYLNSRLTQYTLNSYAPLHKEVGYVKLLPYKPPVGQAARLMTSGSKDYHDLKDAWDTGNEICTCFSTPWLLQLAQPQSEAFAQGLGRVLELLGDDAPPTPTPPHPHTLSNLLDRARAIEETADARLQVLQAQIDEAVYNLYEISPVDRALIERELGDRPPELVWPQLERKSDEEKRREHIRRFFSYYARRAVRQDEDSIVPLAGCATREPYLVDRVRAQLEAQFGPAAAYQLEQDGAEYLGRPVEEWLQRYFFARFHVKLYKKRPILWHLTSPRRYFAVLVDYHRLTRDTLPKVQTLYLWPHKEEMRTRLAAAGAGQVLVRASVKAIADLEDELADLEEMERRLAQVIDSGYNPDIDDGVKANLLPLQEAGLLPVRKVV